jgi:hypothetical protein
MSRSSLYEIASRVALSLIVLALSTTVAAATVKIEVLIKARAGDNMIVQGNESAQQAFLLTDQLKTELSTRVVGMPAPGGLKPAQERKDYNDAAL